MSQAYTRQLRVYIATTTADQSSFAAALSMWLVSVGHLLIPAQADLPNKVLAARTCDLCLVVLGPVFGPRDPLSSFSHTELEVAAAADAQAGKVLVFAQDTVAHPTSPEQQEFIERLRNFTGGTFQQTCAAPEELVAQVRSALATWRPPTTRTSQAPTLMPEHALMISSTGDLLAERDAIHAVLDEEGLPAIDYLRAASEAVAPIDRVMSWAAGCQALLLILGPRY